MKNLIALLILSCFLVAQDHKTNINKSNWHYEDGEEYSFEMKNGKIGTIKLEIFQQHYTSPKYESLNKYHVAFFKNQYVYVQQGKGKMLKKTRFRAYSMYDNGQIKEEGRMWIFKDNATKVGEWEGWYENGQKKYSGSYGKIGAETKIGKWETWYSNGQLRSVGYYSDKELSANLLAAVTYNSSNDIPLGRWVSYYSNGQKRSDGVYQLVVYKCDRPKEGMHISSEELLLKIEHGLLDFYYGNSSYDDSENNSLYVKFPDSYEGRNGSPYSGCAAIEKKGRWFEWYESGWGKEYSVDGVVKSSHKESEQAFFEETWEPEKDKNYQAAYALAQKAFLNAVDNDGDPVGREKDSVEFKSKSKRDKRTYKQFVFTGDLKVMTYRKTTRVRETDPYILEALDAGVGQNYGFSYYKNKTQTYGVGGTGERTYFIECDDGECSIVDEKSEY